MIDELRVALSKCLMLCGYRLSLHPLSTYPGPLLAKLSDVYAGYFVLHQKLHLQTFKNHMKYGVYSFSHTLISRRNEANSVF